MASLVGDSATTDELTTHLASHHHGRAPPIVAFGSIHGRLDAAVLAWSRLEHTMGEEALAEATVVFLGNLVAAVRPSASFVADDNAKVLDWIQELQATRRSGSTVVLAGRNEVDLMDLIRNQ